MQNNLRLLLGKRIKEVRESKNLTQRDMAKELGNASISGIENGKRNVTIDTIVKIAETLKMDEKELLNFTNIEESEMPPTIVAIHQDYPEIPERYLAIFSYAFKQGIRLNTSQSYYYIWVFMNALENKDS